METEIVSKQMKKRCGWKACGDFDTLCVRFEDSDTVCWLCPEHLAAFKREAGLKQAEPCGWKGGCDSFDTAKVSLVVSGKGAFVYWLCPTHLKAWEIAEGVVLKRDACKCGRRDTNLVDVGGRVLAVCPDHLAELRKEVESRGLRMEMGSPDDCAPLPRAT